MTLNDLLARGRGKITPFNNLRATAPLDLSNQLLICIPDLHLLEKGPDDDFLETRPKHEERFLEFLRFLQDLKADLRSALVIVQIGDLYDLWQARGNTNLIHAAYVNVLGNLEKLDPIYVIGNHDIDLYDWYKKQNRTFNRRWRWLYQSDERPRILFEHGFQADFANNQASWSGALGRESARLVGYMEYLDPDIDVILGQSWDSVSRVFAMYNAGLSPSRNPDKFHHHEYTRYYVERMQQYNRGETEDHHGPAALSLSVIGHTHAPRLVSRPADGGGMFYLLDCGSWVNGGHEFGVVTGRDLAVCQWG